MGKQIDKIRVSAGEDLLAFIPHMLGYWPERSIVCIGMSGKRLRATMRLDLPPEGSVDPAGFAAMAASQLASDRRADGCLMAVFGTQDWDSPQEPPHAGLLQALRLAFAAYRLPVRDGWFIGPEHWRNLECRDGSCCPWPGKDNASIKESFVNAEFIYRGSMVGESPEAQIQKLVTGQNEEFIAEVDAAGTALWPTVSGPEATLRNTALPENGPGSGAHQLAATLGVWEYALQQWPLRPDAGLAAFLLGSLREKNVRDSVIVALATCPDTALAGAAGNGCLIADTENVLLPPGWDVRHPAPALTAEIQDLSEDAVTKAGRDYCKIVLGEPVTTGTNRSKGPDWERLGTAEPLLQFLAGAGSGADKAPVLCMLGWLEWCKGRGTWAGHYLALCQQYQPRYRLAELLDRLLATGHIAACAKNPRTAWHGRRDEAPQSQGKAA